MNGKQAAVGWQALCDTNRAWCELSQDADRAARRLAALTMASGTVSGDNGGPASWQWRGGAT